MPALAATYEARGRSYMPPPMPLAGGVSQLQRQGLGPLGQGGEVEWPPRHVRLGHDHRHRPRAGTEHRTCGQQSARAPRRPVGQHAALTHSQAPPLDSLRVWQLSLALRVAAAAARLSHVAAQAHGLIPDFTRLSAAQAHGLIPDAASTLDLKQWGTLATTSGTGEVDSTIPGTVCERAALQNPVGTGLVGTGLVGTGLDYGPRARRLESFLEAG